MVIPIAYKDMYGKDLKQTMMKECSGDFGLALQYLAVDPVVAECAMIKKACDGIGTNEQLLNSIICGRSNKDMELLKKTFYKEYTEDLETTVSGETSGDYKKVLLHSLQAAEQTFDEEYDTDERAMEDAEAIFEGGQGRMGTDEKLIIKLIMTSCPKYLNLVNDYYADIYGYTLFKAVEEEFSGDGKDALLFTLGMKLKPFDTIAKLIKTACEGFGTNELLLTSILIRYQYFLNNANAAHQRLFKNKTIQTRVLDETSGDYEDLLLAVTGAYKK